MDFCILANVFKYFLLVLLFLQLFGSHGEVVFKSKYQQLNSEKLLVRYKVSLFAAILFYHDEQNV